MNQSTYTSKLFRVGNILLALVFAIRGLPRTWLREEQPVTRESGWEIYQKEIALLDTINPQLRIFQSGVLAAALISLAIDPNTLQFWRQLNREKWSHYPDRSWDPVGWLLNQILRHSGYCEISLRPDYQHWLFQATLAAVMFWREARQNSRCTLLKMAPPQVDIPALLEAVRMKKGLRRSPDGFRPTSTLAGRITLLSGTKIEHYPDLSLAVVMADAACEIEEYACDPVDIYMARRRLESESLSPELAAPGAMAAAMLCIARDSAMEAVWSDVLDQRWSHMPEQGSDLAGIIARTIAVHNRSTDGAIGQASLCARIMMSVKSHQRRAVQTDKPRFKNLPGARPALVEQLVDAWWKLPIPEGPHIHLNQVQPVLRGANTSQRRPACQRHRGQGRGRTGRWGERQFADYQQQCSLPRPGKLIDRTTDQCGYDYELATASEPDWYFEVKVVKPGEDIELTEKQWEMAENHGENYWLVLVHKQPDGQARLEFIRNPYSRLPAERNVRVVFQVSWRVKGRDWALTSVAIHAEVEEA